MSASVRLGLRPCCRTLLITAIAPIELIILAVVVIARFVRS